MEWSVKDYGTKVEKRGNRDYFFPAGFKGYGLKVSKKYDRGDDTWLGMANKPKEWGVLYHGT
jgi:hypothetical protein